MSPSGGGDERNLIESVEYLINRGHRLQDILHYYTYEQVNAFCEASRNNEKEYIREIAIATRVSYHAKNQSFKDYINEEKQQHKKPITRDDVEKEIARTFKGGFKRGKKKVKNAK